MMRFLPVVCLLVFAVLALVSFVRGDDPRKIESVLVGRMAPPVAGFDFGGKVAVVNFFASWCVPCAAEQPVLAKMAATDGVVLYGVAYKDKAPATATFLQRHGNPFAKYVHDDSGDIAIEWGVYGVPETFVVGRDGRIVLRHTGAVTPDDYRKIFRAYLRGVSE